MKFEWDEKKNKINIKKHGIDFGDAQEMFDHPMIVKLDNQGDYDEDRWIGIGFMKTLIAVVVFTEEEETIRIISARKATQYERENYEKEIPN